MQQNKKVRFIRKNGRVIPVRQKVGESLVGAGAGLSAASLATSAVGFKRFEDSRKEIFSMHDQASKLFDSTRASDKMAYNSLNIGIHKASEKMKKAINLRKTGTKIGLAGIGIAAAGSALWMSSYFGKKNK